ncbi:sugar ABC transporter ATP-binding protein [Conexibacter sp. CPCC 206217]|uniref:sugar ABC transporter ATP-binding protein n=1 Tax=Conexibacter sp. CPCC 206217 TaxID=3064574 RepID=UPI002717F9CC|nr:sugar ABC transporter ATP-binding protein [Conexibacter sp. CPCC 206217]MDO8212069.1 sugar ABC transporter ATP-binding protein [Conexibacter sp. CPCC 206217]
MPPGSPLAVAGVEKRYGGVHALRGAHMTITAAGVIHGLIGENGSGKSTILGILCGEKSPDAGTIYVDARPVEFSSPVAALAHGIAMVSQETALAPDLSIAENIFLGRRMARSPWGIDWRRTRREAAAVLARLELDYAPGRLVRTLRPDQQQMVEIARALSLDARVLILDEPTSSLSDDEVGALFTTIRGLKADGVSTIFVSHRLKEMFALVDEFTVLRNGVTVAEGPAAEFDEQKLVAAMVGDHTSLTRPVARTKPAAPASAGTTPAVAVRGLTVDGVLSDVDLDVRPGEVVGLAGLEGAGRSELLEAIFGLRSPAAGTIEIEGEPLRARGPRDAIDRGIGYLPPDRKIQGVVLKRTVAENLTMVVTANLFRGRRPRATDARATMDHVYDVMRIRAASPDATVSTLSGGNQQKVALGKWIAADKRLLLLDEPTRGVDVGAKAEIHQLLRAAADRGLALLVSSSENDELLRLCDRILVMYRGAVVASLPADEATEPMLASYAGGHHE